MIIQPKDPLKIQISRWSGPHITKKNHLPPAARLLPELHAQLLDVLNHFLNHSSTQTQKISCNQEKFSSVSFDSIHETFSTDDWSFGYYWHEIRHTCKSSEHLYEILRLKQTNLHEMRDSIRSSLPPIPGFQECLESGTLSLIPCGISGSYFLFDEKGSPQFVIKPLDEDIGAIHNPKGYTTPFDHSPIRTRFSLYRSCFREVAAYEIAKELGISSLVPKTSLAVVQSETFFDLSEKVSLREMQRYLEQMGDVDKEKLCSVQEFVSESKTLFEALQELQAANLLDDEIGALIDQDDFEQANLLLWVTGDTDGHSGNFLVTPKRVDSIGNQIFGLKKIDNGLAFPEHPSHLINSLTSLPNAKHPLSAKTIAKIHAIDPDALVELLTKHNLEDSQETMRNRISALQSLLKKDPSISIRTINKKLSKYEKGI